MNWNEIGDRVGEIIQSGVDLYHGDGEFNLSYGTATINVISEIIHPHYDLRVNGVEVVQGSSTRLDLDTGQVTVDVRDYPHEEVRSPSEGLNIWTEYINGRELILPHNNIGVGQISVNDPNYIFGGMDRGSGYNFGDRRRENLMDWMVLNLEPSKRDYLVSLNTIEKIRQLPKWENVQMYHYTNIPDGFYYRSLYGPEQVIVVNGLRETDMIHPIPVDLLIRKESEEVEEKTIQEG